jgi:hypothetical protein
MTSFCDVNEKSEHREILDLLSNFQERSCTGKGYGEKVRLI